MRVVLDTNILVSAMITSAGNPAAIVNTWLDGKFTLLTCAAHVDELRATLQKPRVTELVKPHKAGRLVNQIRKLAEDVGELPRVERSPDPTTTFCWPWRKRPGRLSRDRRQERPALPRQSQENQDHRRRATSPHYLLECPRKVFDDDQPMRSCSPQPPSCGRAALFTPTPKAARVLEFFIAQRPYAQGVSERHALLRGVVRRPRHRQSRSPVHPATPAQACECRLRAGPDRTWQRLLVAASALAGNRSAAANWGCGAVAAHTDRRVVALLKHPGGHYNYLIPWMLAYAKRRLQ
jgi:hypothetical protein